MTPWPRYLLWVLASIVVLVVLFAPIRLGLAYERRDASRFWLLISVGGLIRARFRLASSRRHGLRRGRAGEHEGPRKARRPGGDAARWAKMARRMFAFMSLFRRIEELEWRTEIGTGDAAATGLAVGSLWALKSAVVGVLAANYVFLRAPRLAVTPAFDKPRFALEIRCIFRFSLGDIIVAALKRLVRPKRG